MDTALPQKFPFILDRKNKHSYSIKDAGLKWVKQFCSSCMCTTGVLNTLCSSVSNTGSATTAGGGAGPASAPGGPYSEVVAAIDLRDPATAMAAHASLSVFTAILIARDCFTFEELLNRVVVHSLKAAWNNGEGC